MKTEMTIEAAMIELNRLKTEERMDIDRDRLTAAIDVLKDAAQFRIKRKPEKIIDYVKKYSLVSRSFVIAGRCPCCDNDTIISAENYCSHCGQALDWSSL